MTRYGDLRVDDEDRHYRRTLRKLQIELVKLQRHLIAEEMRVLVIIEGRDAAGKDGTIKRLTAHMAPRETRVHAPGKPSNREEGEWYFQRFAPFLPAAGEFAVFNRSWYNRAGVERVMGFCTGDALESFFQSVCPFEAMLMRDGLQLRKYYFDISKSEQNKRLTEREDDPLKQWKVSPIDEAAQRKWKDYSRARDEMFRRTSHENAPWKIVRADDKKIARLEFLRDLLDGFSYPGKNRKLMRASGKTVFVWGRSARLAP